MNCEEIQERLNNPADPEVESHLAACDDCATVRETMELVGQAARLEFDPALIEGTLARLKEPPRRRRFWWPAAAAALLIGWAVVLLSSAGMSQEEARDEIAGHVASMKTFAAQLETVEGRNPKEELDVIRFELEATKLRQRTEQLRATVEFVPEARLYVDRATYLINTVDLALKEEPSQKTLLVIRHAAESAKVTLAAMKLNIEPKVRQIDAFTPAVNTEYKVGRIHYYNGNYALAQQHLNRYVQATPQGAYSNAAHVWLADCAKKTGQNNQALFHYYSALQDSDVWSQHVSTLNQYKNTLQDCGVVNVEGQPIKNWNVQFLGAQTRANDWITVDTDKEQILFARGLTAQQTENLRNIKGLDVHELGDAVQIRGQRELIRKVNKERNRP